MAWRKFAKLTFDPLKLDGGWPEGHEGGVPEYGGHYLPVECFKFVLGAKMRKCTKVQKSRPKFRKVDQSTENFFEKYFYPNMKYLSSKW